MNRDEIAKELGCIATIPGVQFQVCTAENMNYTKADKKLIRTLRECKKQQIRTGQ